jgi:intein/homing endonuclease
MNIEDLFNSGNIFWKDGDKEYSRNDKLQVAHYSPNEQSVDFENYNYIYRHKVSKRRFRITTASGKTVDVTEDHSIMVLSDGMLVERKPTDLKVGDQVITIL